MSMKHEPKRPCFAGAPSKAAAGFDGSPGGRRGTASRLADARYPSVHCWLLPPLQVHSSTRAPSAVEAPVTSRQSPDWAPVIVPLALKFHCWFAWPLHGQMIAFVPGLVPWALASRQKV